MHTENVPAWILPFFALPIGLMVLLWLTEKLREHGKAERRHRKRRKSIAYAKTWDWLMSLRGRRVLRLTDQRSKGE